MLMSPERRAFLRRSAGLGLALCLDPARAQDDDPRSQRPIAGDRLVLADATDAPTPLRADDVAADATKPLVALPFDLASGIVRDASKLNRVLLVRLGAQEIAAFSAICTHEACAISAWIPAEQRLLCPCHFSKFDVRDGGAVVEGPAPRGLPRLPLRVDEGDVLVVDGGFSAPPGVRRST